MSEAIQRPTQDEAVNAACHHCGESVDVNAVGALWRRKDSELQFFCPDHALKVRPKKPRPRRRFALTLSERGQLMDGKNPSLDRAKLPAVELPYIHRVTPLLSIEITRATKKINNETKEWHWHLRYTRHDQGRDAVRMLRQSPHAMDFEAIRESGVMRVDAQTVAEAAEESGYTSSAKGAITDAGEAISREYQKVLVVRAKEVHLMADETDKAEELARRQARAITESARNMLIEAAREDVNISEKVAQIQRAIQEGNDEIAKAA
ncbi:MAG: hypothetical protein H0U55_04995 [Rubrobacteraceae bacterium]|nr:hypothetical protein [Rubrobacteraceae bacterium]